MPSVPTNITPLAGTVWPLTFFGNQITVVPGEFAGRHFSSGREVVFDDQAKRTRLRMYRWAFRFTARRMTQIESPEWQVHIMAGHVAERPLTEIPPATPVCRMVHAVRIRSFRSWPEPQIPVQVCRNRITFRRPVTAAPALSDPDMRLGHIANHPGLDDFHNSAIVIFSVDLSRPAASPRLFQRRLWR